MGKTSKGSVRYDSHEFQRYKDIRNHNQRTDFKDQINLKGAYPNKS